MSKQLNLPPFVIFQDPSLEDMAIQYPVKVEELQNIVGVGAGKAKKYGEGFVEGDQRICRGQRTSSDLRTWWSNRW